MGLHDLTQISVSMQPPAEIILHLSNEFEGLCATFFAHLLFNNTQTVSSAHDSKGLTLPSLDRTGDFVNISFSQPC